MYIETLIPTLPERLLQPILADLAPGESAYATPGALIVTPDRTCRLRTDAPIRYTQSAAASMYVTRTATGYIADITYCHYEWTPTDWPDSVPHAPVDHVVFGDEFLQ